MIGKSVVVRPVSLPSTTLRPVTPSPAFHPRNSSFDFPAPANSQIAGCSTEVLLGAPSILAVVKASTRRMALTLEERLQADRRSRTAAKAYRFISRSVYRKPMRIALLLCLATAASAQQAPLAPLPGVPGVLQPLTRLINDYGNLTRYAEENRKVQPPAAGEERVVVMGD